MSIFKRNRLVVDIFYNNRPILYVYKKTRLVWSRIKEILSCFFNGYWIDEYPWTDETPWKD